MTVRVPHLRAPFEVVNGKAAVVEQDSDREVRDCVVALLSTPVGSRMEEPEYGIPDELFELMYPGMDAAAVLAAIEEWEPRAQVIFTGVELEDLVKQVEIRLHGGE